MYPIRINKCPIIDTGIEIRFQSDIFPNAVFGVIQNQIGKRFDKPEKLPILQLPEQVRDVDKNLKFKPYYRLKNDDIFVQVGPDVIIVSSSLPYIGWTKFSDLVFKIVDELNGIGVFSKVLRLGVRYINFFELNIFDKIRLSIDTSPISDSRKATLLRTEIELNGFVNVLHIADNANPTVKGKSSFGSILDIDTIRAYPDSRFLDDFVSEITQAHDTEKRLFFDTIDSEFLKTLDPVYE